MVHSRDCGSPQTPEALPPQPVSGRGAWGARALQGGLPLAGYGEQRAKGPSSLSSSLTFLRSNTVDYRHFLTQEIDLQTLPLPISSLPGKHSVAYPALCRCMISTMTADATQSVEDVIDVVGMDTTATTTTSIASSPQAIQSTTSSGSFAAVCSKVHSRAHLVDGPEGLPSNAFQSEARSTEASELPTRHQLSVDIGRFRCVFCRAQRALKIILSSFVGKHCRNVTPFQHLAVAFGPWNNSTIRWADSCGCRCGGCVTRATFCDALKQLDYLGDRIYSAQQSLAAKLTRCLSNSTAT